MTFDTQRQLVLLAVVVLVVLGTFVHQYAWDYFEPRIPHQQQVKP